MTVSEIQTIVKIMLTADGGCGHCAGELVKQLIDKFPSFKDEIIKEFKVEYSWAFKS